MGSKPTKQCPPYLLIIYTLSKYDITLFFTNKGHCILKKYIRSLTAAVSFDHFLAKNYHSTQLTILNIIIVYSLISHTAQLNKYS